LFNKDAYFKRSSRLREVSTSKKYDWTWGQSSRIFTQRCFSCADWFGSNSFSSYSRQIASKQDKNSSRWSSSHRNDSLWSNTRKSY